MNALSVSDQEFRSLAARITAMAAEFYGQLEGMRAYPRTTGAETAAAFDEPLPQSGMQGAALDALTSVVALSRAPTPRFFGYVLGSGEPVAALADLLASVLNQNVTAWRSAPAAAAIERQVVRWLSQALGCGEFSGGLCGGGSAANLMGLAMAREARVPANESGARPGTVYASSEVHMSIGKAMALLGLGRNNLRLIAVDEQFRMDTAELERAVEIDRAAGREPIAVVASAGTVNTGAVDPLEDIAAVCRKHGLWLHVDGAYGAPAALVLPEKFRGLRQADSMSLDLHKWFYQPVDCGMLLFKDPARARAAFSHSGEYVRVLEENPQEAFAFFDESMELSRRFRALKVWLSLRYHGFQAYRDAIRADLAHAGQLASLVRGSADLELLAPVSLSAVCFRYRANPRHGNPDDLNAAILRRVIENGRVYLSNASIRGRFALRACFVNHRTQAADVAEIVAEVSAAASSILAEADRARRP
ncbi:MAG TPA: aminotransferase class V-fold PLP-dependent enzyme [Steroidobacteraceae bacterium]|nr:aminotransferase class V-fold PLP-dependent enzyme [Steroidobacteraceae bacterium]